MWCERRDSNPHALRYKHLKLARLPISPLSQYYFFDVIPMRVELMTTGFGNRYSIHLSYGIIVNHQNMPVIIAKLFIPARKIAKIYINFGEDNTI